MTSAAVLLVFGRGVIPVAPAPSHNDDHTVAAGLRDDGRTVAGGPRGDGQLFGRGAPDEAQVFGGEPLDDGHVFGGGLGDDGQVVGGESRGVGEVGGRGARDDGAAWELTASSLDRVAAAVRYVAVHAPGLAVRPRVIFTGGWAEASAGGAPPPAGAREGDLMLRTAAGTGLGDLADLYAETRSRSTLENLVHTVDDGLLTGLTFGPANPLGLVTHAWHLPRVRFLVGKVLGLRGPALVDIPATGAEVRDDRRLLLAARLNFFGARRGATLLRRERRMVALSRLARQIHLPGSARRT